MTKKIHAEPRPEDRMFWLGQWAYADELLGVIGRGDAR
jgi:hypothetical protein